MQWVELLVFSIALTTSVFGMLDIDQRENMWVTWANRTGQDSFCLSLATPSSPFRTCLIGVPLLSMLEFKNWTQAKIYSNLTEAWNAWCRQPIGSAHTHSETWCEIQEVPKNDLGAQAVVIAQDLKVKGTEPQEFDLLGSVPGNYCLTFGHVRQSKVGNTWLFPKSPLYYSNTEYCNNWTQLVAPPQDAARKLPPGIFLICGDRAWSAVPQRAAGGPCYFGKLTLFAPSIHQLTKFSKMVRRSKRDVLELDPNCKASVSLWGRPTVIVASIFAPGVASAQALTQLRTLACWTSKQINLTSNMLSELAADVGTVRHAVLQNRAAIDFLLLAQGHGCEEFEGMCCMNLSDHSRSIYKQLAQLRSNMGKIVIVDTPFDKWINSFGFAGWIKDLIHFGIILLIVIIVILVIVPCVFKCVQKTISRAFDSVWVVQKEKGGFVTDFLKEGGHDVYLGLELPELRPYRGLDEASL